MASIVIPLELDNIFRSTSRPAFVFVCLQHLDSISVSEGRRGGGSERTIGANIAVQGVSWLACLLSISHKLPATGLQVPAAGGSALCVTGQAFYTFRWKLNDL